MLAVDARLLALHGEHARDGQQVVLIHVREARQLLAH